MTVFNLSKGAVHVLETAPATAPAIKLLYQISRRDICDALSPMYIDFKKESKNVDFKKKTFSTSFFLPLSNANGREDRRNRRY